MKRKHCLRSKTNHKTSFIEKCYRFFFLLSFFRPTAHLRDFGQDSYKSNRTGLLQTSTCFYAFHHQKAIKVRPHQAKLAFRSRVFQPLASLTSLWASRDPTAMKGCCQVAHLHFDKPEHQNGISRFGPKIRVRHPVEYVWLYMYTDIKYC